MGLSSFSAVSKHNMWSYYGCVCRGNQSVNTTCGRNKVKFLDIVVLSVDILYGGIMVGFIDVVRQ